MQSRSWLPLCLLGIPFFLAGCSTDASSGTGPDPEVDPFGDNGVFLNVLPPGSADANDGNIATDPNSTNQLVMYENLVFSDAYPTPGQLEDGDLVPSYFKGEPFLDEAAFDTLQSVANGTNSARIGRDAMGVPHIFGEGAGRRALWHWVRHRHRSHVCD